MNKQRKAKYKVGQKVWVARYIADGKWHYISVTIKSILKPLNKIYYLKEQILPIHEYDLFESKKALIEYINEKTK